jgi:hypothetical protein
VSIPVVDSSVRVTVGGVADQLVISNLAGSAGFGGAVFNTGVIVGSGANPNCIFQSWGVTNLASNGGATNIGGTLGVTSGRTTTQTLTVNSSSIFTGAVAINDGGTVTGNLSISGGFFGSSPSTRANNSDGTVGQISVDANYIYVCTATNVWKRVALSTF